MDYVSTKTKINGHRVSSVNMDMNSFSRIYEHEPHMYLTTVETTHSCVFDKKQKFILQIETAFVNLL